MAKEPTKGSWIVRMKCVVLKDVYVADCTEDEARNNPFDQDVEDEIEVEQTDWDVQSVEPND